MKNTTLTLVVPCYNEEDNVLPFYQTACKDFENSPYTLQFVFVDDGSRDQTLSHLKEIYASDPSHVTVVSFSRNFGKESAIYAGLQHSCGELITLIDADLQQPPALARQMADHLLAHPDDDCVAMYQEERREGKVLSAFKHLFYKMINSMSDVRFMQGASDFRTFRRSVADAILSMGEYHRFSKGIFSWVGFQTFYMPYTPQARNSGESKWSFLKLFRYAIDGIVAFSVAPLKIANWFGVISALAAFVYAIVVIIQKIFFSIAVSGYATIVILIMFFGGVQLITFGILGEYLARTYLQVKRRPIYLAKQVLRMVQTENDDLSKHASDGKEVNTVANLPQSGNIGF